MYMYLPNILLKNHIPVGSKKTIGFYDMSSYLEWCEKGALGGGGGFYSLAFIKK